MLKGHPKGLVAAALANMGERFGFYTMMAILVLFLQAKFGLSGTNAGYIYSTFYFSIYALAFVGGIIADKTRNFKGTIMAGLILMTAGYIALAIPTPSNTFSLVMACLALFVVAFGNGLFKGNLQALIGQMYDNPKYDKMRDSGFSLFYMFINVGAIFAPLAAVGVRNWWLNTNGLKYNADLPALCHAYLSEKGISPDAELQFRELSEVVSGVPAADLKAFSAQYLEVFSTGFHYAFATAIGAMAISFVIYILNKNKFPDPVNTADESTKLDSNVVEMGIAEVKQRIWALIAVFGVVIFFWFSFHQNGLTLTFFAKNFTDLSSVGVDVFGISIKGAELFQSMNPFFVVFLTPVVVGLFGFLRSRNMEPSTPKKIAIGMAIAALGYVVMMIGSLDIPLFSTIDPSQGGTPYPEAKKVTPLLLLGTYFILTVAELFISPLGISFVSKVAPPKYQGIMQGGWLGATAFGNQLLIIGAILYESIPIWMTWGVFVLACMISMFTMIFMLKWLERVSS